MGPASDSKEIFAEMVKNGLNVARLNLSHAKRDECKKRIQMIKEVREELGIPVGILLDTRGPEIRIQEFEKNQVDLKIGQSFTLSCAPCVGNDTQCGVNYERLWKDVSKGNTILVDDGLIELEVEKSENKKIHCTVKNGGIVKNNKGINVPGVRIGLPALTEKDREDILFGIEHGIDFIAASFIRKTEDVLEIREFLEKNKGRKIQIISKIESQEGIDNLDNIIEVSDAIMVARGDLGVETPAELMPTTQKMMIDKCNFSGTPVVTATQMLDSMMRNPRPTRAEVTDVANAILDGTDAIMLSGETAAGLYPVESVKIMSKIAENAESAIDYDNIFKSVFQTTEKNITNAVSYSTCNTARYLEADAIICPTYSGRTARMMSMFRPKTKIIATTFDEKVQRQMTLLWGVTPLLLQKVESSEVLFYMAVQEAKKFKLVKTNDTVIITAGIPLRVSGSTNIMKVQVVD